MSNERTKRRQVARIGDQRYDCRAFDVKERNGYRLCFGHDPAARRFAAAARAGDRVTPGMQRARRPQE